MLNINKHSRLLVVNHQCRLLFTINVEDETSVIDDGVSDDVTSDENSSSVSVSYNGARKRVSVERVLPSYISVNDIDRCHFLGRGDENTL